MAEDRLDRADPGTASDAETVEQAASPGAEPDHLLRRLRELLNDRYIIKREVGRGGMGIVYLAEDRRHQRNVALKVLIPELGRDVGSERFLKEIQIAASLSHPNILPLYDSGEVDGLLFYVMPFVEGESLRDRLHREKQLPVHDSVQITREVAEALDYAHAQGFIHRDIKPANILLHQGHATLSDFGIARALGEARGKGITRTGLTVGSPAYMSPEQAAGERNLDPRTDLYSLGCVFFEMLSGDPPFTGSTPQAILSRKMVEPVPRLRVVRQTLPEAVDQVVGKTLARVPADRYSTAAEFVRALESALASGEVPTRSRLLSRRLVLASLAAIVIAAGASAWWIWSQRSGSARSAMSVAVLPFHNLAGPDQEYFASGMHHALIGELGRIKALRVISRTSAMKYRNTDKSLPEIARELKVDRVIEGSVFRDSENVRVQVQLLQPFPEERQLWGQSFDRNLRDILTLHAEVAGAIAKQVDARLTPEEEAQFASSRSVNPEAHEAYLRGIFHIHEQTPEQIKKGLEYLHQAVAQDPADPLALAALALGYSIIGHGPNATPESVPRAKAAAIKALELDPTLAEPHAVLAGIKAYKEWDWAGAERDFRRALELNPTLAEANRHYGWCLTLFDRWEEAHRYLLRAEESDPLTPAYSSDLAWVYWRRGEHDRALEKVRQTLELNPRFPSALYILGNIHLEGGKNEEAIRTHETLASVDPTRKHALAYTYARVGRREEARRIAEELANKPRPSYATGLAEVYLELGEVDEAFRWLEYGVEHRFNLMPWIRWNHHLTALRGDPRFTRLLRRMNLTALPQEKTSALNRFTAGSIVGGLLEAEAEVRDAAPLSHILSTALEYRNVLRSRSLRLNEVRIAIHRHHSQAPLVKLERPFRITHRDRDMGQS